LYVADIITNNYLVLSQSTRLTDQWTVGQTDIQSKSVVYRLVLKMKQNHVSQ